MTNDTHNLQFTVLPLLGYDNIVGSLAQAYLEAFVLKDTLDSSIFSVGRELCLKNNTEGAISHDLALGILHLFRLAR